MKTKTRSQLSKDRSQSTRPVLTKIGNGTELIVTQVKAGTSVAAILE